MATGIKISKIDASGTALYSYEIFNDVALLIDLNTPVSPLPLPEETADSNVLVKIEGNTAKWTVDWIITPETTNKFSGSLYDSNVTTKSILEQLIFFMDTFQPKSIDDKYQIRINDGLNPFTKEGFVTKITFRWSANEPNTIRPHLEFLQGDVVTVFEVDAPQPPTGLTAVAGASSGDLNLSWTAPTDTGGSALSDYQIWWKPQNGDWKSKLLGGTGTTHTLTTATDGLIAGASYDVKVKAKNTQGLSLASSVATGSAKV